MAEAGFNEDQGSKGASVQLGACRTKDDSAATVPENRNQSGPYFAAFSFHIPDMRSFTDMREIVKICPRSRWV